MPVDQSLDKNFTDCSHTLVIATGIGSAPTRVMTDNTPAVWTTSGGNFITRSASATPTTDLGYTSIPVPVLSSTYGLSVTSIPSGSTKNFV